MAQKIILFFFIIIIYGCTPAYQKLPSFENAAPKHKVLAILPFKVEFNEKMLSRKETYENIEDFRDKNSLRIQHLMFKILDKKNQRGKYSVKLQNISLTDSLLNMNNIKISDLETYSKTQVCKILNVDAVVYGDAYLEKFMSTGAAMVVSALTPMSVASNRVELRVQIYDGPSNEMIWKYKGWSAQRSSEGNLIDMLRYISKKFPYKKKAAK